MALLIMSGHIGDVERRHGLAHRRHDGRREPERVHGETERVVGRVRLRRGLVERVAEEDLWARACRDGAPHAR